MFYLQIEELAVVIQFVPLTRMANNPHTDPTLSGLLRQIL